jgi:putative copper export protein
MKCTSNPIRHRRNVWPWFVAASVLLGIVYAIVPASYRSSSVLLTGVGSLWAFAFYLHGRHAEDAKFVKELLTDFNE